MSGLGENRMMKVLLLSFFLLLISMPSFHFVSADLATHIATGVLAPILFEWWKAHWFLAQKECES